jgi:Cu-Zn family superoxide dismutase
LIAAALALAGCQSVPPDAPRATASLQPTKGNQTSGTVTFVQVGNTVRVSAVVTALKPGRVHGFHVHNPHGKPHAHYGSMDRHAGDLPALKADASGRAEASFELDVITVAPGPASGVGRGLIVHADPDDYKTQPTGNAGARIACAVIRKT